MTKLKLLSRPRTARHGELWPVAATGLRSGASLGLVDAVMGLRMGFPRQLAVAAARKGSATGPKTRRPVTRVVSNKSPSQNPPHHDFYSNFLFLFWLVCVVGRFTTPSLPCPSRGLEPGLESGDEHTQQVMVCSAPVTVADDHSTRHQQHDGSYYRPRRGEGHCQKSLSGLDLFFSSSPRLCAGHT